MFYRRENGHELSSALTVVMVIAFVNDHDGCVIKVNDMVMRPCMISILEPLAVLISLGS